MDPRHRNLWSLRLSPFCTSSDDILMSTIAQGFEKSQTSLSGMYKSGLYVSDGVLIKQAYTDDRTVRTSFSTVLVRDMHHMTST